MLPNSRAMIHQPGGFQGRRPYQHPAREMLRTRIEQVNEILARHTGQPIEKIQLDTERDNFMGGEEAIAYGLVDQLLDKRLPTPAAAPTK